MTIAPAAIKNRVTAKFAESIHDNPLLIRDFRTRMRGWKAFTTMGAYVLFLAGTMMIAYWIVWEQYSHSSQPGMISARSDIGQQLLIPLTWVQAILLTLIIPSITSGAITLELEKKTMEMLALTRLTPGKIVLGKQLAGFLYALMLLVSSIPISSMCMMFGGVSPAEIAITYVMLVVWAFLLTCSGVMWSSLVKKTAAATGNNFALCFLYFFFTAAIGAEVAWSMRYGSGRTINPFALLNPVWAPIGAMQHSRICGVEFATMFAAIILHIALGLLFLLLASTHVKYYKVERALPIRLLLLGISFVTIWLAAGMLDMAPSLDELEVTGIFPFVLSAIAAASFATGEIRKSSGQQVFTYALSTIKAFKTDIGGGITFALLWTCGSYAVYGLTRFWSAINQSQKIPPEFWTAYWKIGIALFAVTLAFAAVGMYASSLVKQRRSAAALVIIFVILAFAGYGVILINFSMAGNPESANPLWQLAPLWPVTPVVTATDNWGAGMPPLGWKDSAWLATTIVYFAIAFIALAAANSAHRKTGGVVEEVE